MDENINKDNSILLARNSPVALVVGAASFLGSRLTEKLLDKNIQVIGVDDLSSGEKRNLTKASENRNFHMMIESPEKLDLQLARVDYIFIIPAEKWELDNVLALFEEKGSRLLLLSSIDLYSQDGSERNLGWLKRAEEKIARFAKEHNLNARILRLGPVFGPRMDFKKYDPIERLLYQALTGDLQKEITLEFSSRALFVDDAIDLAVKTILSGATAQKIFDGVLPAPYKVSEIKQVLLDPVWYESRDFTPTELPPWPTPNLEKTVRHLNWHPRQHLIAALRETLNYFKDNEIKPMEKVEIKLDEVKKEHLEPLKKETEVEKPKRVLPEHKFSLPWSKLTALLVIVLVTYAIIWPGLTFGWGLMNFRTGLTSAVESLEKGEFEKSLASIQQAKSGLADVKSVYQYMEPVKKTGYFREQFLVGDQLISISELTTSSLENTVTGIQKLLQGIRASTGEFTSSPAEYFSFAQVDLKAASESISRVYAAVLDRDFEKSLLSKLDRFSTLLQKAQTVGSILPGLVATSGAKNYLILLQNNMELRPTGGFIGSFAKVSFEGGKLKKLEVNDIYAIDGQLSVHVEPPKEIKDDLGQVNWYLRDSNWEPDFPTAARQAEWFYTKETGETVDGVIALDISAIADLLETVGPLDLADYNEKVTSENLFAKAVTRSETDFFPGSQAKKSFLTSLTEAVFNKMFFLPQNNWAGIVSSLGRSLDEKHASLYLNDPKLFSYIVSEGWSNVMPRAAEQNKNRDFLSIVEANLGANKANYYLDRKLDLETVIGKDGDVRQRLRINYTNGSPSDTFPGGTYKNRLRIYLPFGTKLERALWAESDITKDVTGFVDYGRSGYSMQLVLSPKEQKTLVLDYLPPQKLEFEESHASYRLDIIKQAGTGQDPLEWTISYPISYQIVSSQTSKIGPQEQTIKTDLSRDKSFVVEFSK